MKPDLAAKKRDLDKWIDDEVFPYLQHLLNKAQRKLRVKICYIDLGQFILERSRHRRNDDMVMDYPDFDYELKNGDARYAALFPELAEFNEIVDEVENEFGISIGGMLSTVRPRKSAANFMKKLPGW